MTDSDDRRTVATATICAALVVTGQVGGKALRDALFLSAFPVTDLPVMIMSAAVLSIVGALLMTRLFGTWGPRRVTAVVFLGSAALLAVQGLGAHEWPRAVAVALYLHIAGFGSLLISGVWSAVSEAFDPAAARRHIGTVATGATAGGLLGGVLAERVAAWSGPTSMFFVIAVVHVICAAACLLLVPLEEHSSDEAPNVVASLKQVVTDSYLVKLTLLVILATVLENLFDYLLKSEAAAALDRAALMRFFGAFYTGVGLLTFVIQVALSRRFLERFGPAKSTGALPAAAGVGLIALVTVPGLAIAALARGGFAVARNSLFRSGYELFFAPLSAARKRSVKVLIDVASDRAGDIVGGLVITTILFVVPGRSNAFMYATAGAVAVAVLWMTRELHRGYVRTLETELIDRGGELAMTQSIMRSGFLLQTLAGFGAEGMSLDDQADAKEPPKQPTDYVELLAGPFDAQTSRLAIDLLAKDEAARAAGEALTLNAATCFDDLSAVLKDTQADFAVRRRIPRILASLPATQAAPALLAGLDDRRFEVRFQCGAALHRYTRREEEFEISAADVYAIIERDVAVSRRLWSARRAADDGEPDSDLDEKLLGARVDRSLQHIFHLLGLIHPARPLRVAFRGLHTDDPILRGTSLEYLLTILPISIHTKLLEVIGEDRNRAALGDADGALQSLLASRASIELRLDELRGASDD